MGDKKKEVKKRTEGGFGRLPSLKQRETGEPGWAVVVVPGGGGVGGEARRGGHGGCAVQSQAMSMHGAAVGGASALKDGMGSRSVIRGRGLDVVVVVVVVGVSWVRRSHYNSSSFSSLDPKAHLHH